MDSDAQQQHDGNGAPPARSEHGFGARLNLAVWVKVFTIIALLLGASCVVVIHAAQNRSNDDAKLLGEQVVDGAIAIAWDYYGQRFTQSIRALGKAITRRLWFSVTGSIMFQSDIDQMHQDMIKMMDDYEEQLTQMAAEKASYEQQIRILENTVKARDLYIKSKQDDVNMIIDSHKDKTKSAHDELEQLNTSMTQQLHTLAERVVQFESDNASMKMHCKLEKKSYEGEIEKMKDEARKLQKQISGYRFTTKTTTSEMDKAMERHKETQSMLDDCNAARIIATEKADKIQKENGYVSKKNKSLQKKFNSTNTQYEKCLKELDEARKKIDELHTDNSKCIEELNKYGETSWERAITNLKLATAGFMVWCTSKGITACASYIWDSLTSLNPVAFIVLYFVAYGVVAAIMGWSMFFMRPIFQMWRFIIFLGRKCTGRRRTKNRREGRISTEGQSQEQQEQNVAEVSNTENEQILSGTMEDNNIAAASKEVSDQIKRVEENYKIAREEDRRVITGIMETLTTMANSINQMQRSSIQQATTRQETQQHERIEELNQMEQFALTLAFIKHIVNDAEERKQRKLNTQELRHIIRHPDNLHRIQICWDLGQPTSSHHISAGHMNRSPVYTTSHYRYKKPSCQYTEQINSGRRPFCRYCKSGEHWIGDCPIVRENAEGMNTRRDQRTERSWQSMNQANTNTIDATQQPSDNQTQAINAIKEHKEIKRLQRYHVHAFLYNVAQPIRCLIDSGASANVIGKAFIQRHGIPCQSCTDDTTMTAFDGTTVKPIGKVSLPCKIGNQQIDIPFYVVPWVSNPIFGTPLLQEFGFEIDCNNDTVKDKNGDLLMISQVTGPKN